MQTLVGATNSNLISIFVNLGVFLIAIGIAIIVIRSIKIEQKGYKLLFVLYILFWIPLMLLRQYTGNVSKALSPGNWIWMIPMCAYGFVGIFARVFADWFAFHRHSRKQMIYLALLIQFVTFIPFIAYPCLTTNILQSIGVGVGASCIGTYQLLFNEQYGKTRSFLTVSLLSIPPLLADFISSSIQSIIRTAGISIKYVSDMPAFRIMWGIGLGVVVITFIVAFFLKEDNGLMYKDQVHKQPIASRNEWVYFVWIAVLGSLIAFIKFANSGAIAQLHIEVLANHAAGWAFPNWSKSDTILPSVKFYESYLSLLFSFGQLIGGLITGLILVNKIGKMWTFSIGCIVWIAYEILGTLVFDPYGYLGVHILNGFAYGIVYNLILGFILQKTFKTQKSSPMGVYQSVLSIGITLSTLFTTWMKDKPLAEKDYTTYFHAADIINWVVVGSIALAWLVFMYTWQIERWQYKQLWWHKKKALTTI